MRRIVFYSWQSDLPNPCNRGFIQTALEEAAAAIAADDSVAVEPVVDRDTQNVPGAPDIASTIFAKIAAADVFVADVSITIRCKGKRPTPNPNVLIELGYALHVLGHERVILCFNNAFGKIEELPFDLRMRRVLAYDMPESTTERAPERKRLKSHFQQAIKAALEHSPGEEEAEEIPIPAVVAIENVQPNRAIVLRRNLEDILKRIDALEPQKHRDGGTVEELIDAIKQTQEVVAEFSKIAELIAVMDDETTGIEVIRWFGKIFDRYNLPEGFSGTYSRADHDYFKFVGHEMFVTLVAFLIREQRWELLHRLLKEPIPIKYIKNSGPGNVEWHYASKHLELLIQESTKRQRISLHGDILNERHRSEGGLGSIMPIEDLMSADFFLFLLSQTIQDKSGFDIYYWRAWSCLNMKGAPAFIRNATLKRVAEQITKALNLPNIPELKKLLTEKGPGLANLFRSGWWDYPVEQEDVNNIGTR